MYYVDKVVGIPGDDNLMVEFVQLCNFREVFSMYFSEENNMEDDAFSLPPQ